MSGGSSANRLAMGAIAASLLVIATVAVLHFTRPGAEPPGNGAAPAANEAAGEPGSNTIVSLNTAPAAPENRAESAPPPPAPPREAPRRPVPVPPRPVPTPAPTARPPAPPGPYMPVPNPPPPSVARPPRLISGAITARDYPSAAQLNGVGGTTGARLTIGPNGRVTNCAITASSGSAVLDRTTCNLAMRRYRYAPAADAQGRPITATIPLRVTWTP